jgi:predicted ester cyclase
VNDQEKKDQIFRIFEVFNRHDIDGLDEYFGPDYLDHSPWGDVPGGEPFKGLVRGWLDAFPDAHFDVENVIVEGDWAAWQVRFTGTNTGSLNGMPPTGKPVDVLGLHMGRLNAEGKPAEHWTGNDILVMLTQIGAIPDMTPAPAAA